MDQTLLETLPIPLTDSIKMEFRLIPPGRFRMGSRAGWANEEPAQLVEITQPFYLGKYPVTQEQFAVWTRAENIDHKNGFPDNPQHPAEQLDWHQAQSFCDWLTQTCLAQARLQGLPPDTVAGLPTEAQWEYACVRRDHEAHLTSCPLEYHTGDGEAALAVAGWYSGNAEGKTHPVGQKVPNDSGLHDMHGNVWEWCHDKWDQFAYAKRVDGVSDRRIIEQDAGENLRRVVRGGSWLDSARYCRASCRVWRGPGDRGGYQGFRVCLFPGPVPTDQQTGARSEPASGDGARRQAAAESEHAGGDHAEVD